VALMMHQCSPRSLLLIDEFGKGTLQEDGVAIAAATVHHLLEMGPKTPKVLFSTHFSELFTMNLLPLEHPNLELQTMDIIINETGEGPSVLFLYKLKQGFSLHSYGLHCAKLAGVLPEVLQRAEYVAECLRNNIPFKPFGQAQENQSMEALLNHFLTFDCETGPIDQLLTLVHAIKD